MNRYFRMTMFWILVIGSFLMSAVARPADAAPRADVRRMVVEEAVHNGTVPPSLALAVARVESNFDSRAHSSAGARGVMQIMPRTAWSEFHVRSRDLWDARTNIRLGVRFLEKLYHQYGERWDLALSHYNGGGIKRDRYGRLRVHSYTRDYVDRVLRASRRYERDASVATLVRRSRRAAEVDADSGERELAYWMYDEPAVDRSWRDYLRAADHWLEQADSAREEQPRESAGDAWPIEEAAYWEVVEQPDLAAQRRDGRARSEALERQISETRERFRERLASDGSDRRS